MQPVRVAVTRSGLPGDGIERLARLAGVRIWPSEDPIPLDELAGLARDAEVLLCVNGDPVGAPLLDQCPGLRLIALASTGYDSVDVAEASRRGIAVTNTPGVLAEATADLAFALILAVRRRVVEADRHVRAGRWLDNGLNVLLGYDVYGSNLGIVGYGSIGRAVARRARGFDMTVRHYSRTRSDDELSTWAPLDELLAWSDTVSIHAALTPETRGLIGARELALLKPTASLINTARGALVDEQALIDALRAGSLDSAGLDVQVTEPNPDTEHALLAFENVVVLPHIGSATKAARARMIDTAVDNVVAYIDGRPLLSEVPAPTG